MDKRHIVAALIAWSCGTCLPPSALAQTSFDMFSATSPSLSGQPVSFAKDKAYEQACIKLRSCIDFILANRAFVAQQLPDNPQYWQQFYALLADGGMPAPQPFIFSRYDTTEFMRAAVDWPHFELVRRGYIALDQAIEVLLDARRASASSSSLNGLALNMIALFIATSWLNAGMAQHADPAGFPAALHTAMASLDSAESTVIHAFDGESNYVEALVKNFPDAPETLDQQRMALWISAQSESHDLIPPSVTTFFELEQMQSEGRETLTLIRQLRGLVAARGALPAEEFWRSGIPASSAKDGIPLTGYWLERLRQLRIIDLRFSVLRALAPMYAGHVQPTTPAVAAPAHWAWEWRGANADLCLVPVTVHQDHHDAQIGALEVCMPYLGELRTDSATD